MRIRFTPQRSDRFLVVSKAGDVVTINGDSFDFSELAEGEHIASPTRYISGQVMRINGEISLTIPAPYANDETPPSEVTIQPADGPIDVPRRALLAWKATRDMLAAEAEQDIPDPKQVAAVRASRKAELLDLLKTDPDIRAALAAKVK